MVDLDPASASTRLTFRPRFCDTDLMGIVHHAAYLVYFEMGRVEWLRRRGVTYVSWAARGTHLPVVDAAVRYRSPARFDDLLVVETRITELRSHSLRFEYLLTRDEVGGSEAGAREVVIAEGHTRLACVDASHALVRLPADVVDVLRSGESG